MSVWGWVAALGFGGLLAITAAIQPSRKARRLVKARDPCYYIPTWTFFAPNPGVTDMRVLWRERLLDGTVGPWHEALAPGGGALRAIWNPSKRARKVVFDCKRLLERAGEHRDDDMFILSVPYLMVLRHVVGLSTSPLGTARQLALVKTQGADDDEDGLFELLFVSPWHGLRGAASDRGPETSEHPKLAEPVV